MQLFLYLKLKIPSFPSLARTQPRARHARPRDAPFGTCRKADTSGRNASRRPAERASVPCGEYSSTRRQVLKYFPQSTNPDSARRPDAFRDRTGADEDDAPPGRSTSANRPAPAVIRNLPDGGANETKTRPVLFFLSLWHKNHVFFILLPLTNIT